MRLGSICGFLKLSEELSAYVPIQWSCGLECNRAHLYLPLTLWSFCPECSCSV